MKENNNSAAATETQETTAPVETSIETTPSSGTPDASPATNDTTKKTDDAEPHKTAKTRHPHKKHKPATGRFIATLSLLLSLGAAGGGYWLWQQLLIEQQNSDMLRGKIRSQIDEVKSEMQGIGNEIDSRVASQLTQSTENLDSSTARQDALEASLKQLIVRVGNTSQDWIIAEADYLLQIANQRIQLQRDIPTAITALKLANDRLRTIGDPALLPVRQTLASEINALETFAHADIEDIALSLASMADQVPKLPLKVRTKPTSTEQQISKDSPVKTDSVEALPNAIWNSLKGLVSIRYNERPLEPLLSPDQVDNLYENLQLKLEQARIALLKENTRLFQNSVERSAEWLKAFFDQNDQTTQKFISKLEGLATTDIKPAMPDISGSLRDLRRTAKQIDLGLTKAKNGGN